MANSTLVNLALLPFAFLGLLFLGTCALCVSAAVTPTETPTVQAEPSGINWPRPLP